MCSIDAYPRGQLPHQVPVYSSVKGLWTGTSLSITSVQDAVRLMSSLVAVFALVASSRSVYVPFPIDAGRLMSIECDFPSGRATGVSNVAVVSPEAAMPSGLDIS